MNDSEEQRAIEAYNRRQALKQAIQESPRAVRRVLATPTIKPKAIIVTRNRGRATEWKSWDKLG